MYVCLCNALREDEVASAIAEGVSDAEEVYARLGVEPQCRSCVDCIEAMMTLATPVSDAA